ncbi:C2 domain-containing protein 5-like [Stylophora pistillata]|uniref:C2 domain-containing protein 5-like n=1 Tax=Stylophora pistillata TaxID=50429 RepID=UPI000C04C3AD|nr:C2 domain-containing protein 5-like [Stylophora pistillata]
MPAKIKVRIVAARDLPVMDRSSDLADAFAEVRLGNVLHKTDVCKKSLNPQWNSEWFRFEAGDEEIQDEPLQIRIMDHDTVTAHDAIGKVNISLGPLLTQDPPGSIDGWFPIYDTMHGIRGEVSVIVKVDFFTDSNKFRQSSCGVQFFYTCSVPYGHKALAIHGFVEELVVNDDPEYQWIDKIRTPRSSNEARQRLFTKLSGELQRKIGLKVLEAGGNTVIGYRQCFDLEGEYGIVVRGIGTAVTLANVLTTVGTNSHPSTPVHPLTSSGEVGPGSHVSDSGFIFPDTLQSLPVPSTKVMTPSRRRISSSDSDPMPDSSPKDRVAVLASSAGVDSSGGSAGGTSFPIPKGIWQPVIQKQKTVEDLEFPFFTITKFPSGFLRHIGGVVTARSVKLLDKINHPDEPETRDAWWSEVRMEIRSHARALGCHAVVGYYEVTSICDELIVLSASGTAACIDLQLATAEPTGVGLGILSMCMVILSRHLLQKKAQLYHQMQQVIQNRLPHFKWTLVIMMGEWNCQPGKLINNIICLLHRIKKVPDVIFATTEPPVESPIVGRGCLLQARVCRTKKKDKGEANADIVSSILPFLEYELHQQLLNKLKVKGMNALFRLHLQISVGESLIIGTASSTAVFLEALPTPPLLKITGRCLSAEEDKRIAEIQKQIVETTNKNRASFKLTDTVHLHTPKATPPPSPSQNAQSVLMVDTDLDEGPKAELDLCTGSKDAYVVEIDDKKDEDVVAVLLDEPAPDGFYSCNTETLPGAVHLKSGVKMITAVQRKALSDEDIRTNQQFAKLFEDTIKSFWFKLRSRSPCCLSNVQFDIEIPEDDNIQVAVTGVAVSIEERDGDEGHFLKLKRNISDRSHSRPLHSENMMESDDLLFPIEEVVDNSAVEKLKSESDSNSKRHLDHPLCVKIKQAPYRPAVEVTSMSYLPNTQIECFLGNINLFLIRESHTVRENGGLNVFMQAFVAEAQAMLRAHVLAIGGNALVSYQLNEIVLLDNPHKHQGQCLLNISGDAVRVLYEEEDILETSVRGTPRKRTVSYSEANTETPVHIVRQRSISASETSTTTLITYDPCYGTEI